MDNKLGSVSHGEKKRSSLFRTPDTAVRRSVGSNDELMRKMSSSVQNFAQITQGAKDANQREVKMGIFEAVRLYPKAIFFSVVMSLAIVMEGYDTALLTSFFAQPAFQHKFGHLAFNGSYQVSAAWQGGLLNGAAVGEILGLAAAGWLAERFGYRKVLLGSLVVVAGGIFVFFFAQNIWMLMAAEIICGLPWGAFQSLTTTYAADVTPAALRPIMTTYVNLCWIIGQFIAAGVLRGVLAREDQWGWRIPYAVQWVWPLPIFIGIFFAPESPWWLVRKGHLDEARKALLAMTSRRDTTFNLDDTVAMMEYTNEHEKQLNEGTNYVDCFKGIDRRRTEIAIMVWVSQVGCGIWFGSSIVYFLEQAGFNAEKAFDFGLGTTGLGFCGTVLSWTLMSHFGRRTLYIFGLSVMFLVLLVVGFLGIPSHPRGTIPWVQGAFLIIFTFTYQLTIGPVCYSLVAEIPSTRLRIKTVVIARNCYNIASIIGNFLEAPILNPTAWNLEGKGGFVWCGFAFLCLVWTIFRLPEPKGRTPAEMDILFGNRVKAWRFSTTDVDPYHSEHSEVVDGEVAETYEAPEVKT